MIRAAIRKDVHILLRDRSALTSLFLLPIVFMGVFGSMFSGRESGGETQVIAVQRAPGNRAAAAVDAITRSGLFRVREEPSAARVEQLVADEEVAAGLVFPRDFDPLAGVPARLVIDLGAPPQVRGPLEGALGGLIGRSLFPGSAPQVLVAVSPPGIQRPLKGATAFQLYVPGNAVLFGFFLALTVGISFIEERKSGTFRRLLAAPVRRGSLLVAKLVPFYLIGLAQMVFLFGIGALAFGMKIGGSVVALVLLTAMVVFAAVSLGLFIASFSGTERQVGAIGSVCLLVMGLLGGGMVPRPIMPETMKAIGLFTPHAWALEGYYDILVRDGTGIGDVLHEILVVAGFGVGFALIGVLRFRFER
ncbi:MAG TPA: ABC transporter permease [Kofleriaceae bacterium]|nr:ABC transporter permease [Kofleriaceae bacterium]